MSFSTTGHFAPTTHEINDLFTKHVHDLEGNISDCYVDGSLLIARAVLPHNDDVTPGDHIDGGVAIHVSGATIAVHPYTLRQVCTNGAVMPMVTGSTHIDRVSFDGIVPPSFEQTMIAEQLEQAIQASSTQEIFAASIEDMRAAMNNPANLTVHLTSMLRHFPARTVRSMLAALMQHWSKEAERTDFDLMNAITATARDTKDPQTRWLLEELGGSVCTSVAGSKRTAPPAASTTVHTREQV